MQGFDRFWAAWPKSPRKGGKSMCLKIWLKNYNETQADLIIAHVEYMKQTEDWRKNGGAFVPMVATYLNQQRWDGAEIPVQAPAKAFVVDQRSAWAAEDAKAAKPSPEQKAKILALLGRIN